MISKMAKWLKSRLFGTEVRLKLDTSSSGSGLAALMRRELGEEQSALIAAAMTGIEQEVPERELRAIHGEDVYGKALEQHRRQKRITEIINEIGAECDRQARREGGNERQDTRVTVLEQARAAAAYSAIGPLTGSRDKALPKEVLWPWHADEFRPHDTRRNLIVAGAHIVGAIERLDRVALRSTTAPSVEQPHLENEEEYESEPGPPPLFFVRNHGMQADRLIQGVAWLIHQQAPVMHIVANTPENLFDVFTKIAGAYMDPQIVKMCSDLAHGANIEGHIGEIHPIIASQHIDPIDSAAPLMLLYPSLETLEWLAEQHGRTAASWFVIPWDWEELAEWLEDEGAEELVFD